ncbi:hypothetical protein BLA29_014126 [Euroglyphus maynei]|uniref:Uncharacterized protein n=1 Tax=Euroglyphus maynei TaxID=6958 RepID=A0A1Y3BFJ1_EURMA|nr:hypothetical protein BLA29_014126 [Euroglyphus maynei]
MNELDNDAVVIELFDKMENHEKNRKIDTFERYESDMFDELFEKALQQNRAEAFVKA